MWDFSIGRSLSLMRQTLPFIALRCAVYFGIALAYVLMTGIGAGVGWGIGALGTENFQATAALFGGLAGLGLTAGILYLLREYILYVVKAGHIAAMVKLLHGQNLPGGKQQIQQAASIVKSRYSQANVLFVIDQLAKGVVNAITSLALGVGNFLPIAGTQQVMGLIRAFLRLAVGLVDEVILAYSLHAQHQNPWSAARTALVLYAQNSTVMLRNAAWLTLFTYGLSVVIFVVLLAPALALAWLMPGAGSAMGVIFALILAWAIKAALLEPLAIASLLQAYFQTTEEQAPDPIWEARLDAVSSKFGELKEKAAGWTAGTTGAKAAETPPSTEGGQA
ncbi:hypothetical protein VRY85_05690 [Achromobacter sp. F4_2707]|uniref:hypothetical protein n=1 Tax=Achromobacter sp. F4_2707 TaxID=3114286 RepID=UPI0039C6D927